MFSFINMALSENVDHASVRTRSCHSTESEFLDDGERGGTFPRLLLSLADPLVKVATPFPHRKSLHVFHPCPQNQPPRHTLSVPTASHPLCTFRVTPALYISGSDTWLQEGGFG